MSKVLVRGGSPGKIRLEVEGTDTFLDIDSSKPAYTALQEAVPFFQALLDAVPPVVEEPKRNSKAPPK